MPEMSKIRANPPVRVRIAPSPTGWLHIGTARTALFNWLYARQTGGVFIVRSEDTDWERSSIEHEKDIMDGLNWLGMTPDEGPGFGGNYGPYRQSDRVKIYEKYLKRLIQERKAYWCFCSKETLDEERVRLKTEGQPIKYSGLCRGTDPTEAERRLEEGDKAVIRFVMPEKKVAFHDMVRGQIEFDSALFGDVVIARGLKSPLYNFSVAIDDHEMQITHVIRGEDHLANTPKQILIQESLGLRTPRYGHLPLILDQNRAKLSKRFAKTSLNEYRRDGYLREAVLNFLVLLGWHPDKDREVLTVPEMIAEFKIDKIQKGGAVYNREKLDWLNAHHIRSLPLEELAERVSKFLPGEWRKQKSILCKALTVERNRMKTLRDFADHSEFFFTEPVYHSSLLLWKETPAVKIKKNLEAALSIMEKNKDEAKAEKEIMRLAEAEGRGEVLWPLRVALSGRDKSPGPFEILSVIGRKESCKRIKNGLSKLEPIPKPSFVANASNFRQDKKGRGDPGRNHGEEA